VLSHRVHRDLRDFFSMGSVLFTLALAGSARVIPFRGLWLEGFLLTLFATPSLAGNWVFPHRNGMIKSPSEMMYFAMQSRFSCLVFSKSGKKFFIN
jgi:hypothetical protein